MRRRAATAAIALTRAPRRLAVALTLAAGAAAALPAGLAAVPASAAETGPRLSAAAAVLVDARDGTVLYRRAPGTRRPVASATKLMTALLSLERLPLGRRLTAPRYSAGPAESRIDLRPGERMSVADLLRALLLESANDAAVTLARGAAGSVPTFVARMNARAAELGLADTHFSNPIGLDEPRNYSSARDLARLARRLLRDDSFSTIVNMPRARLGTGSRPRIVANRNQLVARVGWVDGVKTGHTQAAGWVLVGSGTRKGVRLVSVVLGEPSSASRDADTLALLRYGFSRYRRVTPLRAGREVATARVSSHGGRRASLTVRRDVRLTIRRGERVRTLVDVPAELDGPIERGEQVGEARMLRDGKLVRAVAVVTAERVPAPDFTGSGAFYALLAGFFGASVAAAVLWRRGAGKR